MSTSVVMAAPTPRATPVSEGDLMRLRVLEAYIETLRAENEMLKRRLAAAEVQAAGRERCPWWCRRRGLA
jgi:acetyl esterase/lipase